MTACLPAGCGWQPLGLQVVLLLVGQQDCSDAAGPASPELDAQAAVCELAACDSCHQRLAAARRPQSCFVGLLLVPAHRHIGWHRGFQLGSQCAALRHSQCETRCRHAVSTSRDRARRGEVLCQKRNVQQGGQAHLSAVKHGEVDLYACADRTRLELQPTATVVAEATPARLWYWW